jgi:hypothetical protein
MSGSHSGASWAELTQQCVANLDEMLTGQALYRSYEGNVVWVDHDCEVVGFASL